MGLRVPATCKILVEHTQTHIAQIHSVFVGTWSLHSFWGAYSHNTLVSHHGFSVSRRTWLSFKPWECCCSWGALSCLTPEWPVAPECWSVNIYKRLAGVPGPYLSSVWYVPCMFRTALRWGQCYTCLYIHGILFICHASGDYYRGEDLYIHLKTQLLLRKYSFWVTDKEFELDYSTLSDVKFNLHLLYSI